MDTTCLRPAASLHSANVELGHYPELPSHCRVVVARPAEHPRLWRSYVDGARTNYRKHGVENVLDYDEVIDGHSTALFFAAVNMQGRVVGGMRAQGPYSLPTQAHALEEWAGRAGSEQLQREIALRIPAGIIEMKTGWVADDVDHRSALSSALARFFLHAMVLLGSRFAMCTVAAHAVGRWQTTGGVVNTQVPAVAYPDDRYLTKLMLWDTETYARLAAAEQLPLLLDECAQLVAQQTATAPITPLAA